MMKTGLRKVKQTCPGAQLCSNKWQGGNVWVPQPVPITPWITKAIPHFSKVHVTPLKTFYGRLTWVLIVDNRKKSEEDFCFSKNKWQVKTAGTICFAVSGYRGSTRNSEGSTAAPSPEALSASQHQAAFTLNGVCEHLGCISLYSVYPLSRSVLM